MGDSIHSLPDTDPARESVFEGLCSIQAIEEDPPNLWCLYMLLKIYVILSEISGYRFSDSEGVMVRTAPKAREDPRRQ